ncbi:glutamate-1-semialdehyde 2,1-aminomutase [Chitinophaga sp. GCM10012297]|uniref:Glutamate-1-semialdehyde 2,1-aminomutase n=1 Tax=Chitinophaga chungangae TaxID=2821488 RepID=A0ABS3Y902_9BACT|nr:glutamate-1-semialdehyde 2,1-aminomutase [Chitinophaga chungangae]MBO9151161.1 glutamate-1-semialdehyde 2,1-aminomutase [Chitinophaga chungangae]
MYTKSKTLFEKARQVIPGGVNSPVRAFRSVGGTPVFMQHAKGAYMYDVDGNRYIDYINSWGPMILGHAYEPVVKAIQEYATYSTSFGAPTELEIAMAELIVSMVPNIDMVRMVNSGTEACMSALRLARGFTGRNKVIKFEGNYHGHADSFLVSAGSGVATLGIQSVPGVTATVAEDTLSVPYNNLPAVEQLVAEYPEQIAAIIVEPVAGNMGCILPQPGFLEGLRTLCDTHGIVFIMDEVMTGFRLAKGGAQELLGVKADIVTFGKIIGGGMPVGAFAGRREIMEHIAPSGKIYQAGTLSGNPIAMIAGYTLLKTLQERPAIYTQLEEKTSQLVAGLRETFGAAGVVYQINHIGSMMSVHFAEYPIVDFTAASGANNELFRRFFHAMLERGVYLPPSAFESWFISHALGQEDIEFTINAAKASMQAIK